MGGSRASALGVQRNVCLFPPTVHCEIVREALASAASPAEQAMLPYLLEGLWLQGSGLGRTPASSTPESGESRGTHDLK